MADAGEEKKNLCADKKVTIFFVAFLKYETIVGPRVLTPLTFVLTCLPLTSVHILN